MTEEYFKKFLTTYKLLNDMFPSNHRSYLDGYMSYRKTDIEKFEIVFEFVKQFQKTPFSTFFRNEHMESFTAPQKYFGIDTVTINEHNVQFHYGLPLMLFAYLCHSLRPKIEQFIKIINSKDFKNKFNSVINIDEYGVEYLLNYNEEIYNYLINNVEDYKLIHVLFLRCNSGIMVVDDNKIKIRIPIIHSVLNTIDSQYNFKHVHIK